MEQLLSVRVLNFILLFGLLLSSNEIFCHLNEVEGYVVMR